MVDILNKKIKKSINKEELPFVSIIVLNYNGKQHLKECFESLNRINYPQNKYEVIMVDNGSTDNSISYVKNNFPWVRILELDKNYGFTEGNNKGAKVAKGEYIAFLNNDTKVDKEWLIELVKAIVKDKKIAACSSKVLFFNERNVIQMGGGKLYMWGYPYQRGFGEKDHEKFNKSIYIHHCTGSAMLVRKQIFINLGGFDTDFMSYHEDVDFGWRVWIYGFKNLYIPSSIVYHKGAGVFGRSSYKIYLIGKNASASIIKNFNRKNLIKAIFIQIFYLFFMFLWFLSHYKYKHAIAQLKVYYAILCELKKNLEKRKKIQKNRKISDSTLYELNLISNLSKSIKENMRLLKITNKFKI